jgi:hypothetical protein
MVRPPGQTATIMAYKDFTMPASKKKMEAERPQENNGEVPTVPAPDPGADGQPTEPETPTTRTPKRTTRRILEGARREVKIVKEGKGKTRQPDISLRGTPLPDCPFRAWPKEEDYFPVYLLKKVKGEKTKSLHIIDPKIVEEDVHVRRCVIDARLVPCLDASGRVYVWVQPELDPTDSNYKMQKNLEEVRLGAVDEWTEIHWLDGFQIEIRTPLDQDFDADWPTGQLPSEWQELAIEPYYIDDPNHPEILGCRTRRRILK